MGFERERLTKECEQTERCEFGIISRDYLFGVLAKMKLWDQNIGSREKRKKYKELVLVINISY